MFTLAIIGRTNVGKSTLFNRLAGKQLAIVDDTPGVTRDWREAEGHLFDLSMRIIDTAGLEEQFDDSIQGRMRQQTEAALTHADAVLFVIDGRSGITPQDEHFAAWLRRQKKPVVLVVNKAENDKAVQTAMAEGYGLGLGTPIAISSAHGTGLEDLYHALLPFCTEQMQKDRAEDKDNFEDMDNLDAVEGDENFEFEQDEEDPEIPVKIAIVGRPNVGKSTLLNAIVQDNRVMVGPEAGITRDAIAVDWRYQDRNFKLVDTAGLRRKSKVQNKIEKMSVEDTLRAIRLAQVVILVLDSNQALEKQDLQIAEHIIDEGRALVIAFNKWDAVTDYEGGKKALLKDIEWSLEKNMAQIKDIKYVTTSALNGKNIDKLLQTVLDTYALWNIRVPTGKLNRWLKKMEVHNPAPLVSGRQNRLKYMTQIKTRPPTFAVWVSQPKELPQAYRRYIINGLRRDYDIPAVPIRLLVRTSKNPYN